MSERLKKLNDHLRDEVAKVLHQELRLEGIFVTVMGAIVSPTLEHATIRLSIYPKAKAEQTLKEINIRIYPLQQILNKRLVMRPVPKLRFVLDTSEEHASRIDEILQKNQEK